MAKARRAAPVPREAAAPRTGRAWSFAAVFLVAAALRLVVLFQISNLPISRTPHFDALEYRQWALRLAGGDFSWPIPPPHGPGYPFFLGILLHLTGNSVNAALALQALLGAGTCVLVALLGAQFFGRTAGLFAGSLLAIYAPLIWTDVSTVAEGLLLFLISSAVLAAVRQRGATSGLLAGIATIVRPTALVILPLLLFAGRSRRVRLILLGACILPIAIVTAMNWVATRSLIPVQGYSGFNLYLGNSPLRDGLPSARPGGEWERLEPEAARLLIPTSQGQDRYFAKKAFVEIGQRPLAFLCLLAMKSIRLLQDTEIRDSHSFYFFRGHSLPLRLLPTFSLLFALAACGLVRTSWRDRGWWMALALVVLFGLTCVALVVGSRYRMPMVIGLALLAGAGGVKVIELARGRSWPALVRLAFIAIVAAGATRLLLHSPSYNTAEEVALNAQSQLKEGATSAAEADARAAQVLDPASSLAADTLGLIHADAGLFTLATADFERAVRQNPYYARAYEHLGRVALQSHEAVAAARAYGRAASLDPRDSATSITAARLAAGTGALAEARSFLEKTLVLNPANGSALLLLANIAADLHDVAAARKSLAAAQQALDPTAETRFMAAVVDFKTGAYDDAEKILALLATEDPSNPEVQRLREANGEAIAHRDEPDYGGILKGEPP
ncbi:MAG: hypothetical protein ABI837_01290, partial [Acidobacteriota bacterium]